MNITFMIGNGFDLACGLKSSYSDVYKGYIKTESKSELIAKFKKDLDENWENWSDFEMGMAEYAKNFKNEEELIECVTDFREYMEWHLQQEEDSFSDNFDKTMRVFGREIEYYVGDCIENYFKGCEKKLESLKTRADQEGRKLDFISFNYTGVLRTVLDQCYYNCNLFYIHGTLEDNDVILGADNEDQVKTPFKLGRKGKRVFVKPFLNANSDPDKVDRIKSIIQNSDCVIVFGLSMGESDLTWRNEIKDWLISKNTHNLFLIDYESSRKAIKNIALRLNEQEDIIVEKLNKIGIGEEYIDQVHIPVGRKMFAISEKIDEIAENELNSVA